MRKQDDNRAENYIRKHRNRKRWIAFALCVTVITGTSTLYMLNKPATAMTEDGAKQVGIVLETADSEWEEGMIEAMDSQDEGAALESSETEIPQDESNVSDESVAEASLDESELASSDASAEYVSDEESASDASSSASSDEESSSDASSLGSSDSDEDKASKSASVDIKEDVVITVLYEDINGEALADSKELSISESLILPDEARAFEGYNFSKAEMNGTQITSLYKKTASVSVSKDEEEDSDSAAAYAASTEDDETVTFTYYEAVTLSGETIQVTENTDLHLSYFKVNTKTEFISDKDSKVKVKAVLSDPNALPDGVELVVSEITSETEGYNYDAYMQALNENAGSIADEAGLKELSQYTDTNTLMYDIAFMFEGKEYEPTEGTVSISIEFKNKQLTNDLSASSEEDITVVHLPIKSEVMESSEITSTQEATEITAGDIEVKTLTDALADVGSTEKIEFSEESFSVFAVTVYQDHTSGTHDYEVVLGDAINFGIVSRNLHIGESQSNFAAANLYGQLQSGNNLTNFVEQTFLAGTVQNTFKVKNFAAYFIVPAQYAWQISHDNINALKLDTAYTSQELTEVVEKMLEYARKASADLAKYDSNIKIEADGVRDKIDLRGYPAGTYYVNLKDVNALFVHQEPTIYKRSDQNIVFNVTDPSSDIYLKKFKVSTDGGQALDTDTLENNGIYDGVNRTIIWNFINAKNVYSSNSVVGVFLSGRSDATWYNDATSAGWLVFPNVYVRSGEWHNTNQKLKQISGTAQFQAYKNIDNKEATVSGFTFKLSLNTPSGWKDIQFVNNDEKTPHNIIFDPITYGDKSDKANEKNYQYVNLSLGQSQDFIYVIDETAGASDSEGNFYTEDERYFFAKVTVTCERQSLYTDSTYYRVSEPQYFYDFECTKPITEELPTFNNTTSHGTVGIKLYKYLNGEDPGDNIYSFTVRVLKTDGTLKNLTESEPLYNIGKNLSYSFDYDSSYITLDGKGNKRIYLVITENNIENGTTSFNATKDNDYIIARIDLSSDGSEVKNVYYFKYDYEQTVDGKAGPQREYIDKIESGDSAKIKEGVVSEITKKSDNSIKDESQVAFYNTCTANLRIHKMVVNDFGSKMVRDRTDGLAILDQVTFRVTNNETKRYIIVEGFTGRPGDTRKAKEYEIVGGSIVETGNQYTYTYNRSAQWTISDIPVGTYTVEEVGDGLTFEYDVTTNTSSIIYSNNLSRVTKYGVTDDKEGASWMGTGGNNYRAVFSADIPSRDDNPPSNVKVGDVSVNNDSHTQTVQVCNYYSIPVGPLQVTKNFVGGTWKADMPFTFTLSAAGYVAYDSEGRQIELPSQPMPEGSVDGICQVTLTGADATDNSATVQFPSIPYRFEGTYYYKITEENTGIEGVTYDTSTYYVEVVVTKKETRFQKRYTYDNMANPEKYTADALIDEYFFYLGADVRYATDEKFENVVATCSLNLNYNPDTEHPENNKFVVSYAPGCDVTDVAFTNSLSAKLTVSKTWIDVATGNDISDKRTSLTVNIWRRAKGGEWTKYGSPIQLSDQNGWTRTITGLPIYDENGTPYEYCAKEDDSYLSTYLVTYSYDGKKIGANDQKDITVDGETVKDTGYYMSIDDDEKSFGEVEIINESVYTNVLPSTGGAGTVPFTVAGLLLILAALAYLIRFKAKA